MPISLAQIGTLHLLARFTRRYLFDRSDHPVSMCRCRDEFRRRPTLSWRWLSCSAMMQFAEAL